MPHTGETTKYCTDERHEVPCPLPCSACAEECGLDDQSDSETSNPTYQQGAVK